MTTRLDRRHHDDVPVHDLTAPLVGDLVVFDGPYTLAERDAIPANGYRHELLDGMLVMQASPSARHQEIAGAIYRLLHAAAPPGFKVFFSPFDVRDDDTSAIQPDIVVCRREDVDPAGFTRAPLLCVEVASPSTRDFDQGDKKDVLARVGCPDYWTVEPDAGEDGSPELTAWSLRDGAHVEAARVSSTTAFVTERPFTVTVIPAELVDD